MNSHGVPGVTSDSLPRTVGDIFGTFSQWIHGKIGWDSPPLMIDLSGPELSITPVQRDILRVFCEFLTITHDKNYDLNFRAMFTELEEKGAVRVPNKNKILCGAVKRVRDHIQQVGGQNPMLYKHLAVPLKMFITHSGYSIHSIAS